MIDLPSSAFSAFCSAETALCTSSMAPVWQDSGQFMIDRSVYAEAMPETAADLFTYKNHRPSFSGRGVGERLRVRRVRRCCETKRSKNQRRVSSETDIKSAWFKHMPSEQMPPHAAGLAKERKLTGLGIVLHVCVVPCIVNANVFDQTIVSFGLSFGL